MRKRTVMEADADGLSRAKRTTLPAVVVAVIAIALVLVLPGPPALRVTVVLVGAWLLIGSVFRYEALRQRVSLPMFRRSIPIRFGGNLGRFTLRALGDGRRVEIHAGAGVVAEAIATDEGDELVVDLEAVDDADLDALGTAIGAAIEMVATADEAHFAEAEAQTPDPEPPRLAPTFGGVLQTIGSRSH
jgi:hypothetical protein